jgi:hypothetical protein
MGLIRHSRRGGMSSYQEDGRREKKVGTRLREEGRRKTHPMSLGGTPTTDDMTYFPRMGKPNF